MNQPYDVYAKLEDPMGVLGVALAQWEIRDDSQPQPEVREAANTALDAIDAMVRELYAFRSRLVTEMRASDDATGRRVDELLGRAPAPLQPHGYDPDSHIPGNSCTYCGRDQDDPLHGPPGGPMRDVTAPRRSQREAMISCVNCGEPIRRTGETDRIDPRDYGWVHEDGNLICDLIMVASPGGDGYGPAPVVGYLVDGKTWHPSDVTIVRRAAAQIARD